MGKRSGRRRTAPWTQQPPCAPSRDASDVCMLCGMCCDGTLFGGAVVEDGESEHVVSLGLEIHRREDGSQAFLHPCPRFTKGCCGVYEQRPQVCRDYNCGLLPEYEAGRISLDDCTDVIESMRSLTRYIEEGLAMSPGSYNERTMRERLAVIRPQDDPHAHEPLLVALDRFQRMAISYFGRQPVPADVAEAAADAAQAVPLP